MQSILARIRDAADAHNIIPIVSQLQAEGYTCAIVCDASGKAFSVVETHFTHLLPITVELATREELYQKYPRAKVYLSSMLPDDIGREPIAHYKNTGAWTTVFQETPGWRLNDWDTYPDAVFAMAGGASAVQTAWPDFKGDVIESGMPQYEDVTHVAETTNVETVCNYFNIAPDTRVLSLNIPAYYANEVLTIMENVLPSLTDVAIICGIHPKASEEEKTTHDTFCDKYKNIHNRGDYPFIECFAISEITIGSIVSTTLVQANLAGSKPIALATKGAAEELETLGNYTDPQQFPYVTENYFALAKNPEELTSLLVNDFTTASFPQNTKSASSVIIEAIHKKLQE